MSSTTPQDFGTPLLLEDYIPVPPPVTPDSAPLCAVCHSSTSLQRCSTCKSLHYCSMTCQTLDWGLHKQLCKPFTTSAHDSKLPDASYQRALYLPELSEKPRFTWLKYGDDGRPLNIAKCFPEAGMGEVKTIAFHNRYLPYWIQISYSSNASGRALSENTCVSQLLSKSSATYSTSQSRSSTTGTETMEDTVWRRPLVVLAYSAEEGLSKPALDVEPSVLGPVVEYLGLRREYAGPVFVEQPQEWYGKEWKKLLGGVGQ